MAYQQPGCWHPMRPRDLRHIRSRGTSRDDPTRRGWRCGRIAGHWRHPGLRSLTTSNCWPPAWPHPDRTGAARWLVDPYYQNCLLRAKDNKQNMMRKAVIYQWLNVMSEVRYLAGGWIVKWVASSGRLQRSRVHYLYRTQLLICFFVTLWWAASSCC